MKVKKRRSDYTQLFWLPHETFLEILIFDEYTIVKSQVEYKRNNNKDSHSLDLKSHLELNGEDLVTKKFLLIVDDNTPKNIQIHKLKKVNDVVEISVPSNSKIIKTITEVKIFPSKNKYSLQKPTKN